MSNITIVHFLLAALTLGACNRGPSRTTPSPVAQTDSARSPWIRIRGTNDGPLPLRQAAAVAFVVDSVVSCPRTDSVGVVVWPPAALLDPRRIVDSVVVLRGAALNRYASRCPLPLDAVVRITTRSPSSKGP